MEKTTFEYGAMSSMYSCEAENKLTAYVAMVTHYNRSAHMLVIYSPKECKEDNWASFDGKISARLDEVFGGPDSFDKYCEDNQEVISQCYKSIKQIV